jgi:NAD(P)-dependent dehydrogenase (short-subunit alcohol dehydrogenase family)
MRFSSAVYPSLADRVVFITGGGSGIGAAMTRAFARQQAHVAFVDIADEASRRLVDEVQGESGVSPLFLPCDVRDIGRLTASIAAVRERLGPVGILINNAANDERHRLEELTPQQWDERMSLNLRPAFFTSQAVVAHMRDLGGGSIINLGSICWRIGAAHLTAYATAKAAMHGLTRSLARELGELGIRVNTLSPGCVMTERQLQLWVSPAQEKIIQAKQYVKGRILPEHIANCALFLASDDSAMLTAQEMIVDGGWA